MISATPPEPIAEEFCIICKDEMERTPNEEALLRSSYKPQAYRCHQCRNYCHMTCILKWHYHSRQDEDEVICPYCSGVMNRDNTA